MAPKFISSITFRAGAATICSLTLSLLVGRFLIEKFKKAGFVNYARQEGPTTHYKKKGMPLGGGVIILLSFLVSLSLFGDFTNWYLLLALLVTVFLGVIGFWDDLLKVKRKNSRGLTIKVKLLLQLFLASFVALYLYFNPTYSTELFLPFTSLKVDIGLLYLPLVGCVLLGTANSVNLTDGLDGLAAGCFIFAGATYAILAYLSGHSIFSHHLGLSYFSGVGELVVFWGALLGATLGFLWYNAHPAQVFMGDTGATALGGALGITALLVKKELLLLLIGGIFVVEALSVLFQIASFKLTGKRILKMSPIHHHYELLGLAESKIIVRFWIIAIFLALLGLTLIKW